MDTKVVELEAQVGALEALLWGFGDYASRMGPAPVRVVQVRNADSVPPRHHIHDIVCTSSVGISVYLVSVYLARTPCPVLRARYTEMRYTEISNPSHTSSVGGRCLYLLLGPPLSWIVGRKN